MCVCLYVRLCVCACVFVCPCVVCVCVCVDACMSMCMCNMYRCVYRCVYIYLYPMKFQGFFFLGIFLLPCDGVVNNCACTYINIFEKTAYATH